jgi:hypothetical protein
MNFFDSLAQNLAVHLGLETATIFACMAGAVGGLFAGGLKIGGKHAWHHVKAFFSNAPPPPPPPLSPVARAILEGDLAGECVIVQRQRLAARVGDKGALLEWCKNGTEECSFPAGHQIAAGNMEAYLGCDGMLYRLDRHEMDVRQFLSLEEVIQVHGHLKARVERYQKDLHRAAELAAAKG